MSEVISDPTDVEEPGLNSVLTATQPHLVITVLHQGVLGYRSQALGMTSSQFGRGLLNKSLPSLEVG